MQSPLLLAGLAFILGGLVAWLIAQARGRKALREGEAVRAALDRDLAVERERTARIRESLDAQKAVIETSRKAFEDTFQALAAAALKGNSEQFLQLADQRWATTREQAAKDLKERRQAIETLLAPLGATLKTLESRTGDLEKARRGAYEALLAQIRGLQESTRTLADRTTSLDTALRSSTRVSGRWGEIALRNIAELAGMTEHCDFEEQETVAEGKRPDMIVRLPGDRFIAVDSKVPLAAYLEAAEAVDDASRDAALDRHVNALRGHVRALAARDYAGKIEGDVDLVVLFLPGDPILAAAFARDPDLQVEALRAHVLVATPTTLIALLRTVSIYWREESMARDAREIAETARELYERAAVFGEHLGKVGKGLGTAVAAYNSAVGSFERRLLPAAARLERMKVDEGTRKKIEAPAPVEEAPRGSVPSPSVEDASEPS